MVSCSLATLGLEGLLVLLAWVMILVRCSARLNLSDKTMADCIRLLLARIVGHSLHQNVLTSRTRVDPGGLFCLSECGNKNG